MQLHIGFDDTDSPSGGCTTYVAALLVEKLLRLGARFIDYPNLVRLNPNVPWKTRGNGAISLRLYVDSPLEDDVRKLVIKIVEDQADFDCDNTNPGIVFLEGEVPSNVTKFSDEAIQSVVNLNDAMAIIDSCGASAVGYKDMRGVIGALAAVGGCLQGDHTYEFLAYRMLENRGKPRLIDAASVFEMDAATTGETFSNVDEQVRRPLIAPHGPDPVLFGVRGESPEAVHRAGMMIKTAEPVERSVIFRTNQGTDSHLKRTLRIADLRPFAPAIVDGKVSSEPRTIPGGHTFISLEDETGSVDCAAFEPTGHFRDVVTRLIPGDEIKAYGGVKTPNGINRKTLNLEKIEVTRLENSARFVNPTCPKCGSSMESMGRDQGYRCRKCRYRGPRLTKRAVDAPRELALGLYLPPPRAQRHLTKPLVRYGREKGEHVFGELFDRWHSP